MKADDHMEELFKWFVKNFKDISDTYSGQAVVIKDFKVINSFKDQFLANKFARDNYGYGEYIIQEVSDDTSCYITRIASAQFFK